MTNPMSFVEFEMLMKDQFHVDHEDSPHYLENRLELKLGGVGVSQFVLFVPGDRSGHSDQRNQKMNYSEESSLPPPPPHHLSRNLNNLRFFPHPAENLLRKDYDVKL